MSASHADSTTVVEREGSAFNGWVMLVVNVLIVVGAIVFLFATFAAGARDELTPMEGFVRVVISLVWFVFGIVMLNGHFTLQPNEARVLILFGAYHGTVRQSGFHWANPFYAR